jgi:hypothetical protein
MIPAPAVEPPPVMPENERLELIDALLQEILSDPDAAYRSVAVLYQDFLVRCRIRRLPGVPLDLPAFRRRLAIARAGVGAAAAEEEGWGRATEIAAGLPEEIQGVFLLMARAALAGDPCPPDAQVARVCGSQSQGRARRLLSYMETQGVLVARKDMRGNRIIALPDLGCETAPGDPAAADEASTGGDCDDDVAA